MAVKTAKDLAKNKGGVGLKTAYRDIYAALRGMFDDVVGADGDAIARARAAGYLAPVVLNALAFAKREELHDEGYKDEYGLGLLS